ncbi:MAG TPA: cache domain-containing protein, partial [Thalassobaculum sp.]
MRLRSRLVLLILATMVPLLAFSAATQYHRYRAAEQRAASEQVENKARAVHQAVQARLVALRVLALEPELQTGDFAGFHRTAQALIANELPGASVLVLGHDGRQLMNTVAPAGMPLPPRKSLDSLRRVFQTGQPVLSDLFTGALTDTPVVAIEVPVKRRDGTVVYDLVLNPTPNAFLAPIHDPASTAAVTTVYDRAGVVVTRSSERSEHIGRKAPEPLLSRILAAERRPFRLKDSDGRDKVVALSRVEPFGWTVAIELPADELARAALRSLLPTLAVGGILVVLSAALAAVAAQRIAAPIDALRRMEDDPSERDRVLLSRLPEVRDVARALSDARQRVREHTSALERMIDHRDLLLRE